MKQDMGALSGSRADASSQQVVSTKGFDPARLLADICSERVIHACDYAKAVPGDVWGQGAEGHYAFLAGLAALLRLPGEVDEMIENSRERAEWWKGNHPDTPMSMCCPKRVLEEFGFTAIATEAGTAETTQIGSVEDEGAGPKGIAQTQSGESYE
jgi:hypothetical protein